jgi:hypothetical protein
VRATDRGKRVSSLRINNEFEEFEEPEPGVPRSWADNQDLYGPQAWAFDPLSLKLGVSSLDLPDLPIQLSSRAQLSRTSSNSQASFSSTERPKAGLWEHCFEYGIWMSSDGALDD